MTSASARTEAVRDAKRFLLSAVRDDWSFSQTQPLQSTEEPREPLDYKCREEGSSDVGADSDEPNGDGMLSGPTNGDPYRFESPDAIAVSVQDGRHKRRRLTQDELKWNDGLRTWSQQRNVWTGAVRERPAQSIASSRRSGPLSNVHTVTEPRNALSSADASVDWSFTSQSPLRDSKPSLIDSDISIPTVLAGESSVLLPVYPPLLPSSNPVRASIKPSMYTAIYSKVVVQGLTPTIPIPLPHMVAALVQGWKAEGNWPPKGGAPSMSITNEGPGSRRHAHGHMLRFKKPHDAASGHEKGRVRRHVGGAMRKALGLSREGDDWEQPSGIGIEFEDDHKDEDVQMERDEKSGNVSESFRVD